MRPPKVLAVRNLSTYHEIFVNTSQRVDTTKMDFSNEPLQMPLVDGSGRRVKIRRSGIAKLRELCDKLSNESDPREVFLKRLIQSIHTEQNG